MFGYTYLIKPVRYISGIIAEQFLDVYIYTDSQQIIGLFY